jgi:hypothetical protein
MDDYESLSHTKWECKYHVVFIPKCRRKTLYTELRRHLGMCYESWPSRRKAGSRRGIFYQIMCTCQRSNLLCYLCGRKYRSRPQRSCLGFYRDFNRDRRDVMQTRRRLLATLSSATVAGLFGGKVSAQEAPPEITTIRLGKIPGVCIAPQYVAEELLRGEGFTNVQYVELSVNVYAGFTAGTIDISMAFIAPYIIQLDAGLPLV